MIFFFRVGNSQSYGRESEILTAQIKKENLPQWIMEKKVDSSLAVSDV